METFKSSGKPRVLILSAPSASPFVLRDVELLKKHFPIQFLAYQSFNGRLKKFIWELLKRLFRDEFDVCVFWFSPPRYSHIATFLCRFFGKKVIIIVAGGEVVYFPKYNYGGLRSRKEFLAQKVALTLAHRVVSASDFSAVDIRKIVSRPDVETIYNGVDCDKFRPFGTKENLVVTVCFEINNVTMRRKGLDVFLNVAKKMPHVKFLIVGKPGWGDAYDRILNSAPANLSLTGRTVTEEELIDFYQRAKVYFQASIHEAFGIAIAESMASGCVPVVANRTAMPEVVDGAGYLVDGDSVDDYVLAVRKALTEKPLVDGRKRVVRNFSMARREKHLVRLVSEFSNFDEGAEIDRNAL